MKAFASNGSSEEIGYFIWASRILKNVLIPIAPGSLAYDAIHTSQEAYRNNLDCLKYPYSDLSDHVR